MKTKPKIKRQRIRERVDSIHFDDLSGYFDDIIKFLSERKAYYEQKFPDAYEIWVDYDIDVCYMDESIKQFDIFVERPENDQEYNSRVKKLMKIKNQERSAKEQEEYEEYQTYLSLKKKYSK